MREQSLFSGQRTTLQKLLKEMGFGLVKCFQLYTQRVVCFFLLRYKKIDNRRHYYEQPRIVAQRHSYLHRMRENRTANRPVVYLDETWANAHDGKACAWVEKDSVTGGTLGGVRYGLILGYKSFLSTHFVVHRRPSGKGSRLIILGAGGRNGWVPNTTLIFRSKKDTGDYHDEMTAEHFEEWFASKLLPNVQPNSLIVMDNASYHSRRSQPVPVKSWTKKRMQEWLRDQGMNFPPKAKKAEIFEIIKRLNPTPRYFVDDMAEAAGWLHTWQLLSSEIMHNAYA